MAGGAHRLGDGEHVRERARIVDAGAEVGVLVRGHEHHLPVAAIAGELADHVVRDAAVALEGDLFLEEQGRRHGPGREPGLEPIAVAPRDIGPRRGGKVVLSVETAQGLVVDREVFRVLGRVRADDARGSSVRGFEGGPEEPPRAHPHVDEDELAGDVAGRVELGRRAALDIDDRRGDPSLRGRGDAGDGGGDHRPVPDGDARLLEFEHVDGDGLEPDVREAHGPHLGRDPFADGALGGRPGPAEAQIGVGAERAEIFHELLRIALRELLIDGLVERRRAVPAAAGNEGPTEKRMTVRSPGNRFTITSVPLKGFVKVTVNRAAVKPRPPGPAVRQP